MFPLKKKETPKENGKKNQTSILWRWSTFRLFQPLGIIILRFWQWYVKNKGLWFIEIYKDGVFEYTLTCDWLTYHYLIMQCVVSIIGDFNSFVFQLMSISKKYTDYGDNLSSETTIRSVIDIDTL